MANTVSTAALRPEIWQKELYKDVIDNLYFTQNGLMGEGEDNIVQIKKDLVKQNGDQITIPLTAKLSGNGVTGDAELEGNEEAISQYSDAIVISQKRFAVRLTGRLDEQMNAFDMRSDAKKKLSIRLQEFIERQIFFKLAGVNNTSLTDINDVGVAADCAWSNAPDRVPDADELAGYGKRYLCADYAAGLDSLATTDLLTPALISMAKVKAMTASPQVLPLKISGRNYYVMFVHPWQAMDLKNNATFAQAQREADVRGDENKIFTGALGIWDGVVLKEHEYVPFLDISGASTASDMDGFNSASGSDCDASADAFRALLCGKQAVAFAQCKNDAGWVEETFDYKNKVGFATGIIGGIQKVTFNSKDYGVIAVDTYATHIS
jgi:N4-gp56 family major capsid protein